MTTGPPVTTQFAPAERASCEELGEQRHLVTDHTVRQVLDGCPNAAAILNPSRQIVFCNRALVGIAEGMPEEEVWGARPGEILKCQHSSETPGGCGTTEFCRTCGAVLAILDGQEGRSSTRDCRITRIVDGRPEALDLRVTVSPMPVSDRFVMCAIQDVSHETRRRALERIFFHDILNTAVALQTRAETLSSSPSPEQTAGTLAAISRCAERLLAEIESQRMLLTAENGELSPRPIQTTSIRIAKDVVHQFDMHPIAERKHLVIPPSADDVRMRIDTALLDRVLVNMVKNALEASRPGETVTIGCRSLPPDVEFQVRNQGTIPHVVRLQIFQRSFSTKGPARGLGTYSMKLFAEYLKGNVWFETSPEAGTTFFLRVPANAPAICT